MDDYIYDHLRYIINSQRELLDYQSSLIKELQQDIEELERQLDEKHAGDGIIRTDDGINHPVDSINGNDFGINRMDDAFYGKENIPKQPFDSNKNAADGNLHVVYSSKEPEDGANHIINPLPPRISASKENILRLTAQIKMAKLLKLSLENTQKVAKLLIHIYNEEGGSIKELKLATGYSASGMAKVLMNLRKKRVLVKHKVRDHRLTALSLSWLQRADIK